MSVNFYLAPKVSKAGEQMIRLSVVIYKTRLLTTVGIGVPAKAWNSDTQSVLLKIENNGKKQEFKNKKGLTAATINNRLHTIRSHFSAYEQTITQRPTEEDLKQELKKAIGVIDVHLRSKSLLEYFDQFVKEESENRQWTPGTLECWAAFRNHLKAQGEDLSFAHFNNDGIRHFIKYLREKEMGENTVQKHYGNLRWFLNWAIRRGYAIDSEIGNEQPKFKVIPKPVIFLTKEELLKLYHYQIPDNGTIVQLRKPDGEMYEKCVHDAAALGKTRDMFCFCCCTGLRYSDMAQLCKTDVANGKITVTTQKTNERLSIELLPMVIEILKKYQDEPFPNNLALPVISNQRMNQYIKDLSELCEINEPITRTVIREQKLVKEVRPKFELMGTHAGRRTFICYALSCDVPVHVVMKWTGHKDYKSMLPYIEVAEKVKKEEMKKMENNLSI